MKLNGNVGPSFTDNQQARPASSQNVYSSYDPTPSPIAYGSPSQQGTGPVMNRINKTNTTSPTPTQSAWSLRQQPVTEGYQFNQLSPSRSPSGPTYTQLSGGARSTTHYTPNTAQSANAGMFCFNINFIFIHRV